ncbi:MAG: TPM domain-containing protein [Dysgonamonadaceae bacterium]|nr:TPM domain-containing protein [Dysgonamonadaceae bacterium]
MNARNFFSEEEKTRIVNAIKDAEAQTTGEIRVHIAERCPDGVLNDAAVCFEKLKMHKTRLRNGVLFFLAIKDRKFAIIGDVGINSRIDKSFWEEIKAEIGLKFHEKLFTEGLVEGISSAGVALKRFFPLEGNPKNELPDEISFG